MTNRGVMKEIRIEIKSELAMNVVHYFMSEENYVYVGNERDIWLENLSHPTVQLIYLNQRSIFNEEQAAQLLRQVDVIRSRLRRRYLMRRLNVLILNVQPMNPSILNTNRHYLKVIQVNQVNDLKENEELKYLFPRLVSAQLDQPMAQVMEQMHDSTKEKALNLKQMLMFQTRSTVTYVFLLALIAIFVFLQFQPLRDWLIPIAIDYGAKYNPLIAAGEYGRLLTSTFLHFDLMHLLFNVVFIYQFGRMVEHVLGWWRTAILIVGSAILGNLCSYAFVDGLSIGASTVAYGLLGAVLFLGIEQRKIFMHFVRTLVFPILAFSIFWVILEPGIDVYGHLGGFIGGFLIASILGLPKQPYYFSRTLLAGATVLMLITGLLHRGATLTEQTDYRAYNRAVVAYYYQTQQLEKLEKFNETLHLDLNQLFQP